MWKPTERRLSTSRMRRPKCATAGASTISEESPSSSSGLSPRGARSPLPSKADEAPEPPPHISGGSAPKIGGSARKIFDRFDLDGSGSIDASEMGRMLRSLKMDVTPAQLEELVRDADPDGSGEIDFEEFVSVIDAQASANAGAGGHSTINLARVFQEAAKPINVLKADVAEVLLKEGAALEVTLVAPAPQGPPQGPPDQHGEVPSAGELSAALERIGRQVGALAETMDEELVKAHREEMRAAAATAKLKLEATRTSNKIALKNQARLASSFVPSLTPLLCFLAPAP